MWGQGAGGAQGVPGTVTPLRVCEEVYLGASVLYITQRGTLAGAGLRESVTWRGVHVPNGCTCARVCARGGVSAPEPVGCAGVWGSGRRPERCRPSVCAAGRPLKGWGKVTGGRRVGKLQEFLQGI